MNKQTNNLIFPPSPSFLKNYFLDVLVTSSEISSKPESFYLASKLNKKGYWENSTITWKK